MLISTGRINGLDANDFAIQQEESEFIYNRKTSAAAADATFGEKGREILKTKGEAIVNPNLKN